MGHLHAEIFFMHLGFFLRVDFKKCNYPHFKGFKKIPHPKICFILERGERREKYRWVALRTLPDGKSNTHPRHVPGQDRTHILFGVRDDSPTN